MFKLTFGGSEVQFLGIYRKPVGRFPGYAKVLFLSGVSAGSEARVRLDLVMVESR